MIKPVFKQAWVISGVLLTMMELGMFLGFTTCLLPALKDPKSNITASLEMSSWIAAIFNVACIPGVFFASYYMDYYGRRITYILGLIPGAVGLLLMYFATNVYCLLSARALQGFTASSTTLLGVIIVAEYSDPVHRGFFCNLKTAAIYIGSSVVHFLGNYYHWRFVALITLVFYIINFGMIWTWPESPAWLASLNNFEASEHTFYWLRGKNEKSTKELKQMLKAQKKRLKIEPLSNSTNILKQFRRIGSKSFLLPLVIISLALILLETSGRHIFPAFAVQIISEISQSDSSEYYTLLFDILIITSTLISSVLIRMFNRRVLLFITGAAAVVILMSLCGFMYFATLSLISKVSWIPLILFGLYLILVNSACAPVPLVLIGEIYPLGNRALGILISGVLLNSFAAIALKTTPTLLASVKVYGTFSILGVAMALSLIFLYFLLPETKDRTLQEIEDYFNNGGYYNNVKDRIQENQEEADVETEIIS